MLLISLLVVLQTPLAPTPFGAEFPRLDSFATGEWWNRSEQFRKRAGVNLDVPRDQVVAFALYTHDSGVLKMTAQFFPLRPGEERLARLELERDGKWREVAQEPILYPGWTAHFRVDPWDGSRTVRYRVRHSKKAMFEGTVRRDPREKTEIVVGCLSCNSSRTTGPRSQIVENLRHQNPDLLFFAGDQNYRHTEATAGWLEFGLQFREILKDRPVITIPDDHDVGQSNLWGESGKKAATAQGPSGGYYYPSSYVNMVERQQTWHLPDRARASTIGRGFQTYFTRMRLGGIDFAILEDRKFKSGPKGKIPKMGPRPDHINDPAYDRASVDLPGLELLGKEQLDFLARWSEDWTGAEIKCVLSQTAFCGAVHLHGTPKGRLLADLDCNGWPQAGRNLALRLLRQAGAVHLCGDQHLAVVVQHGIEAFRDGPFGFTVPAIVNTIYGRWWHPEDETQGDGESVGGTLPWTGDYLDGLGNRITMHAYANPGDRSDERQRADGYGVVRFDRAARRITFECWPRFGNVAGGGEQFPGWPITISVDANDGRRATHWLEPVQLEFSNPVVQVIRESDGEILYTRRVTSPFRAGVFAAGRYTMRAGNGRPDLITWTGLEAKPAD